MKSTSGARFEILAGVVACDPAVQEGEPVFAGTDVLIKTFIDYRAGHSPLYEFLLDFPEVTSGQARKLLDWCAAQEREGFRYIVARLKACAQDPSKGLPGS